MKEKFLTLTALRFTMDGRILGNGCAITPGLTVEESVESGAIQMGSFHPAAEAAAGKYTASLEKRNGLSVTFAGGRFILAEAGKASSPRRLCRFG